MIPTYVVDKSRFDTEYFGSRPKQGMFDIDLRIVLYKHIENCLFFNNLIKVHGTFTFCLL